MADALGDMPMGRSRSISGLARYGGENPAGEFAMSSQTHLSELEEEMAQAIASEDFETAAALRDQIDLIRRDLRVMEQPDADAPQASYLRRQ